MFAYGMCALFASCFPLELEVRQRIVDDFVIRDGRMLKDWSREMARKADKHLPDLLESLLLPAKDRAEALRLRRSATQVFPNRHNA